MISDVRLITHTFTELGWPNPSQHSRSSFSKLPARGKELVSALLAKYNRDDIRVRAAHIVSMRTIPSSLHLKLFHINRYV